MGRRMIDADRLLAFLRDRRKIWQATRPEEATAWARLNEDVCLITIVESLAEEEEEQ